MYHFIILLFVSLASGFQIWEDATGGSYRFNPYYYGQYPHRVSESTRPRFKPAYVTSFAPLANWVLLTDPSRLDNTNRVTGTRAQSYPGVQGLSYVVAMGPTAQTTGIPISEGDMVLTNAQCPTASKLWLNKPTLAQEDKICRSRDTDVTPNWWCQERRCAADFADRCEVVPRTMARDERVVESVVPAPYCLLPNNAIRGRMTLTQQSPNNNLFEKTRSESTARRMEDVNANQI
eukprot:NODE_1475_length_1518_cov_196.638530_g1333_i0.p1 GENE.NODE_1475_length_1518_cov_196.638530_g1333_i0~~NODE_1475_length_1518_cov_196.638530_g1333_i0.p1  ORF type:complete len:234 (-),score=21.69 NODE_1475_length_1518_cov_196.638530_g1333_i0:84-785(-)